MGKLEKFLAKPMEVEIGGESYMVKPFTVADLTILTKMESKDLEVKVEGVKEAIFKIAQQIDEDATPEIVGEMSIEYLEEFMNAIFKVNNIDVSDAKQELIGQLKK